MIKSEKTVGSKMKFQNCASSSMLLPSLRALDLAFSEKCECTAVYEIEM